MKWITNLENIVSNNDVGECPYCGSQNTEYSANRVNKDFGYLVIWCNSCKKAINISRVKITQDMVEKTMPNDLVF